MWGPVKKGGEGRANLIITPHTADTLDMVLPLFTRRFTQNAQALISGDGSFEGVVDAEHGY
ncbi:hypothetical protein CBOM_01307 [Ceraceosorus bombacis]|uniref:Uncharacterized protein n=1 Tax=Ceraceosorus bombacis TaxID=401625 RepID=A0A0P1BDD5_9BASI|nr:hypothetical protein CBOM_01307 [Ceraceosorus bombacis]